MQVLIEQFRSADIDGAEKLLSLDGCDELLASSPLAQTLVQSVRDMRRLGLRVILSAQSAVSIPEPILESASLAVMHRLFAPDSVEQLRKKLPLTREAVEEMMELEEGEAVVFAATAQVDKRNYEEMGLGSKVLRVRVRERLTLDGGLSRVCE